ncbi:MAG: hypothetical protein EPO36_06585 [Chloroflexota bacterium]|nr:MAG: hypothetical protein EPO36_06585 [Chloroflexota bacterium]
MIARPEPAPSADAVEFVKFCYQRRKVGWPELYDEMCGVAGRGLFRGWGPDDLATHGIGFSLGQMPALAALVTEIVTADRARTRAATGSTARPAAAGAAAG